MQISPSPLICHINIGTVRNKLLFINLKVTVTVRPQWHIKMSSEYLLNYTWSRCLTLWAGEYRLQVPVCTSVQLCEALTFTVHRNTKQLFYSYILITCGEKMTFLPWGWHQRNASAITNLRTCQTQLVRLSWSGSAFISLSFSRLFVSLTPLCFELNAGMLWHSAQSTANITIFRGHAVHLLTHLLTTIGCEHADIYHANIT